MTIYATRATRTGSKTAAMAPIPEPSGLRGRPRGQSVHSRSRAAPVREPSTRVRKAVDRTELEHPVIRQRGDGGNDVYRKRRNTNTSKGEQARLLAGAVTALRDRKRKPADAPPSIEELEDEAGVSRGYTFKYLLKRAAD